MCVSLAVPHANLFVVVNPIRLVLDYTTILWLNAFALNLLKRAVSTVCILLCEFILFNYIVFFYCHLFFKFSQLFLCISIYPVPYALIV